MPSIKIFKKYKNYKASMQHLLSRHKPTRAVGAGSSRIVQDGLGCL